MKDGFYPIVVGGDHSQAIGSISGMKDFSPDGKVIWIDAHIDANTPASSPSKNAHGMPLAFLSGIVPIHKSFNCMDMARDICYFGIRSYETEEELLLKEKRTLVFETKDCEVKNLEAVHKTIHNYFDHTEESNYWISFDIDGVDGSAFPSTGTTEGGGLSLDFTMKLFERFIPETIGMDFTEVNFELTEGHARHDNE